MVKGIFIRTHQETGKRKMGMGKLWPSVMESVVSSVFVPHLCEPLEAASFCNSVSGKIFSFLSCPYSDMQNVSPGPHQLSTSRTGVGVENGNAVVSEVRSSSCCLSGCSSSLPVHVLQSFHRPSSFHSILILPSFPRYLKSSSTHSSSAKEEQMEPVNRAQEPLPPLSRTKTVQTNSAKEQNRLR